MKYFAFYLILFIIASTPTEAILHNVSAEFIHGVFMGI